jgi:hypothetical protein
MYDGYCGRLRYVFVFVFVFVRIFVFVWHEMKRTGSWRRGDEEPRRCADRYVDGDYDQPSMLVCCLVMDSFVYAGGYLLVGVEANEVM